MLSVELGTYLAGRHLSMELFPFSYSEFIRFKELENEDLTVYKDRGECDFVAMEKNTVKMIPAHEYMQ